LIRVGDEMTLRRIGRFRPSHLKAFASSSAGHVEVLA
jgi:hypothetical protein